MSKPTKEQIKAIKAKYKQINNKNWVNLPLHSKHEFMVKNLADHGLLNSRMSAKDIAFSHKKNFGGIGKVETAMNPNYKGHYNNKGIRDENEYMRNLKNRSASRYGQGNYKIAVPKGDKRSGTQEWKSNNRVVNYL
jgi:hypothetical protein